MDNAKYLCFDLDKCIIMPIRTSIILFKKLTCNGEQHCQTATKRTTPLANLPQSTKTNNTMIVTNDDIFLT